MDTILRADNVRKNYFNKKALNGISLNVESGKIVGLLGPNGSGKTTFIKIIAGLIKPSSGEILVDNNKVGKKTKEEVAYLPDVNYLYRWMKIRDAVDFFEDFYKNFDRERCNELLKFMELEEDLKVTSLSKGMMEKLNLALIFARKAKLYILDEPLGGIDIKSREKIIDTIINSYSENSSILISTHLVADIERMFDEVVFISSGEIILSGNAEELRLERKKSIEDIYKEVF